MKNLIIIVIIVIAVLVGYFYFGPGATPEIVKVGFMAPLTGDVATYGESVKEAVEFALAESGLTNIELIFEDTKCEGKDAANAVNKLVNVDGVAAIIGALCSGGTLAAAPVADGAQVVMVSPASTSPDVSNAGEFIYRTVPSDALQGTFGAQLVNSRGLERLAILYTNDDYGQGFEGVLQEEFPKLGGEVVASEAVERGATDARTQLTKIRAANPDAIYIISNSTSATVSTLKQIRELGITATIFGSEGLRSPDITEGAGVAAEGLIISSVSSGSSSFIDNYKATYGQEPGPFAAQAYDAFMIVANAIRAGATTGPEIKAVLDVTDYTGASGQIVFDSKGDVSGNYDVVVIQDGEFVPAE